MEARDEGFAGSRGRWGYLCQSRASWGLAPIGLMLVVAAVVHLWWLPRHGINGLTGEPREKYFALKGWARKP